MIHDAIDLAGTLEHVDELPTAVNGKESLRNIDTVNDPTMLTLGTADDTVTMTVCEDVCFRKLVELD